MWLLYWVYVCGIYGWIWLGVVRVVVGIQEDSCLLWTLCVPLCINAHPGLQVWLALTGCSSPPHPLNGLPSSLLGTSCSKWIFHARLCCWELTPGRIQWGENKPFAPRENDWELAFPCNKARAQPWTQKRRGPPLTVCQMFFRAQENACNCQGSGNNNEAFQYKWCVGTCLCPGPPSPLLYSFAALH